MQKATLATGPMRKRAAIKALGGDRRLFRRCEDAGWFTPVVAGHYDKSAIESAWKRLASGEQPEAKE